MSNHSWSAPAYESPNITRRACNNPGCGIIRISRHEPANDPPHWTEFERHGKRVGEIGKTPVCSK